MFKLAICFLVRILIFKLYFISIPDNDAKNLLSDFYIDQNLLILSTATRDYSISSSYAKNLLRLNIYNMFFAYVIKNFQLKLILV